MAAYNDQRVTLSTLRASVNVMTQALHDRVLLIVSKKAQRQYPDKLSKDEYLMFALECADLCMKSLKIVNDLQEKTQIRNACNVLLDEADRAKKTRNFEAVSSDRLVRLAFPGINVAPVKRLDAPVSSRQLPKSEQLILWRGSKLNGHTFPPWTDEPKPEEFALGINGEYFEDPSHIPLSSEQMEMLDGWKRPSEAVPPPNWALAFPEHNVDSALGPSMALKPGVKVDLVQDAATDCSVVASFSAGIARGEKGHARILAAVVYPYDHNLGVAQESPNGKYIMRMSFNGCSRKVVIDDRLPVSKTKRLLHVIDRNFPNLLWPALVEKAYLKIRGGYDFPGSNSGTDIWIIMGWIPEQVFLQHEDTDEDQLWRRLLDAHQYGDVLTTLGTSRITPEVEQEFGLAGDHDYAVLDVKECHGQRRLLIKNPWLKATAWKGSSSYTASADDDENLAPGTYWMSMHAVTQNFMTMYLNWNPGLFTHRQDFHFTWDLASPFRSPPGSLITNPQYTLRSAKGDTVWLLLSRHFQDNSQDHAANHASSHASRVDDAYISLYAFQGRDRRVYLSKGVSANSLYVDAPQTLLRVEAPPNVPFIIAPSEQHLPQTQHIFSLFAFSRSALTIAPASPQHASRVTVSGAWTFQTAGGTPSTSTYGTNPQYSLTLPQPSRVTILLENPESNVSINVVLAHSTNGKRIHALNARDVICSSGSNYRRGCALATTVPTTPVDERDGELPAGAYIVVASTFDPGCTGSFVLHADTDCAAKLYSIPRDGAGLLRFPVPDALFEPGVRKVVAQITTQRLTRLRLLARHNIYQISTPRVPPSPIRIGIEVMTEEKDSLVWTSKKEPTLRASSGASLPGQEGSFSDVSAGVRIDDIDVLPNENGRCWLVLERLGGVPGTEGRQVEERVVLEGSADVLGGVEVGTWRNAE